VKTDQSLETSLGFRQSFIKACVASIMNGPDSVKECLKHLSNEDVERVYNMTRRLVIGIEELYSYRLRLAAEAAREAWEDIEKGRELE